MSRLSYMRDHEIAIQTILDELHNLELLISSGKQFSSQNIRNLNDCLGRLDRILKISALENAQRWEADEQPHPHWLRPKSKVGGATEVENAKKA